MRSSRGSLSPAKKRRRLARSLTRRGRRRRPADRSAVVAIASLRARTREREKGETPTRVRCPSVPWRSLSLLSFSLALVSSRPLSEPSHRLDVTRTRDDGRVTQAEKRARSRTRRLSRCAVRDWRGEQAAGASRRRGHTGGRRRRCRRRRRADWSSAAVTHRRNCVVASP